MNEKLKIPAISGAGFFLLLCDQDFMMNQLDTIILMRRTSEIHPEQPRTHMMMECVSTRTENYYNERERSWLCMDSNGSSSRAKIISFRVRRNFCFCFSSLIFRSFLSSRSLLLFTTVQQLNIMLCYNLIRMKK